MNLAPTSSIEWHSHGVNGTPKEGKRCAPPQQELCERWDGHSVVVRCRRFVFYAICFWCMVTDLEIEEGGCCSGRGVVAIIVRPRAIFRAAT